MFTGIIEEKGKIKAIKRGAASSVLSIEGSVIFDDLKIGELKSFSEAFDEDVYEAISLKTCVEKRLTLGAPGSAVMDKVIEAESKWLSGWRSSIQ